MKDRQKFPLVTVIVTFFATSLLWFAIFGLPGS